jgi:hypothetical protein
MAAQAPEVLLHEGLAFRVVVQGEGAALGRDGFADLLGAAWAAEGAHDDGWFDLDLRVDGFRVGGCWCFLRCWEDGKMVVVGRKGSGSLDDLNAEV